LKLDAPRFGVGIEYDLELGVDFVGAVKRISSELELPHNARGNVVWASWEARIDILHVTIARFASTTRK